MSTLNEAGWRALNPRGPVDASSASYLNASYMSTIPASKLATINASKLNIIVGVPLGMPIVGSSNNVATGGSANIGSATSYATLTATVGSGGTAGGVNVPRNLRYQLSYTGDSTQMHGATGTVVFAGTGLNGSTLSESIALTDIGSAVTDGYQGTAIFSAVSANYTVSSWSIQCSSLSSKSITLFVGGGNKIGLPYSVTATNAVLGPWIAGTNQAGSVTIHTGGIGTAAIEFSNALDATNPVHCSVWLTRCGG